VTNLLYSIIVAALLSSTSLLAILFRVSPLSLPGQAVTAFFVSLFLTVASVSTLLFAAFWKWFPIHAWDEGKTLSISLRQGLFLATAVIILLAFHIVSLLTWWIAVLIVLVFILIETALHS
jgi:hypothetical protein